jgi:hypothetical protein
MATILQTVDELADIAMLELGVPTNESLKFKSYGMDFVRMLRIDGKTGIANEQKTAYYDLTKTGYTTVSLPQDYVEFITVGTQLGRYIKALSINAHLTDHKIKPQTGLLTRSDNMIWYWGNLWGLGTSLWGPMGQVQAYGNGGDYGDFNIDLENRKLILSPTLGYTNIVLKYMSNCMEPSNESQIHPYFIMAFKEWVKWKYFENRGDQRLLIHKNNYAEEYLYAWRKKNRKKTQDIVKIIDRTRGYRNAYF